MITLRVNPYSLEELEMLPKILESALLTIPCKEQKCCCRECNYRHICSDVWSAKEHAEKIVEEAHTI